MNVRLFSAVALATLATTACGPSKDSIRADSAIVRANRQQQLATQLSAQKDSITRVVLEADDFIMRIDSSVSRVKGLPKGKRNAQMDPLAQQLENRKAVIARVDALVARARATAAELAKSQKDNVALRQQLAADTAMIADLNATIQRQSATIEALTTRVDSLNGVNQQLVGTLATLEAMHNKAFYVIGREDDLLKRGVVVREGGANLLLAHPGRTLQISRTVDASVFTAVDQRTSNVIEMPDTTHRYKVVSRQSLDYAVVDNRDRESFKGNLKIGEPVKFWAASRFLVIVEQ